MEKSGKFGQRWNCPCSSRDIRCCVSCFLGCWLFTIVLSYLVIFHSHRITCHLGYVSCIPIWEHLQLLDYLPRDIVDHTLSDTKNKKHSPRTREECIADGLVNLTAINPCPDKLELVMLIAQQHGGTVLTLETLQLHSQIDTDRELILNFWHYHCSQFARMSQWDSKCNWDEFVKELHNINANYLNSKKHHFKHSNKKAQHICDDINIPSSEENKKRVWIWKLQIQQIFPAWFDRFADYAYCNNITIIHLIRRSTVASLWSLKALVREAITEGKDRFDDEQWTVKHMLEHKRVDQQYRIHHAPLQIDNAEKYVRELEENRQGLINSIGTHEWGIKSLTLYFEDLIHPGFGYLYWYLLEDFFGVEHQLVNLNTKSMSTTVRITIPAREHSDRCSERIENWKELKPHLKGTLSYKACEQFYS